MMNVYSPGHSPVLNVDHLELHSEMDKQKGKNIIWGQEK